MRRKDIEIERRTGKEVIFFMRLLLQCALKNLLVTFFAKAYLEMSQQCQDSDKHSSGFEPAVITIRNVWFILLQSQPRENNNPLEFWTDPYGGMPLLD